MKTNAADYTFFGIAVQAPFLPLLLRQVARSAKPVLGDRGKLESFHQDRCRWFEPLDFQFTGFR